MHEEIKDMALSMPDNSTSNGMVCPNCSGGNSGDRSLSVTKDGGLIKFICYRASCNYRGVIGDNPNNPRQAKQVKPPRPFTKPTLCLPPFAREYLLDKFLLNEDVVDTWLYDEVSGRVVMPVFNYLGATIGHVARSYPAIGGESGTKSIAYWDRNDTVKMYFPLHQHVDDVSVCYVVEDIVSAERVNEHVPCVALLGTNLSHSEACYLHDLGYTSLVFMLDEDAWDKAAKMAAKNSLLFKHGCTALMWDNDKDPKDMSTTELSEVILYGG